MSCNEAQLRATDERMLMRHADALRDHHLIPRHSITMMLNLYACGKARITTAR
ncbi:MAG TPA: hypothetical protein V6C69_06990 [Trichormus sp.]